MLAVMIVVHAWVVQRAVPFRVAQHACKKRNVQ